MGHLTKQDFWQMARLVHDWHVQSAGDIGIEPGRFEDLVSRLSGYCAQHHRKDSHHQFNHGLFKRACYGETK